MNLPNALTVGRIAITPLLIWLPLMASWPARLAAFALFLVAAWSDYYDGHLARVRGMVTDLGKLLDPLADKLLLVGTFVPMFYLQAPATDPVLRWVRDHVGTGPGPIQTPFLISIGGAHASISFYWWIAALVLGREVMMTVVRQVAARRGTVIAAIGSAKLKTIFQLVWIGAAYFWFFVVALAGADGGDTTLSRTITNLCGVVGSVSLAASVVLGVYSLGVYLVRYRHIFLRGSARAST